jgi:outer membrane protein TolC
VPLPYGGKQRLIMVDLDPMSLQAKIDTGLPTDLLERRPDVAEAEREMAAANARIGVARSAYFPSVDLLGSGGWQSANVLKIFDVPSLVWAVGASVAEDVFTGARARRESPSRRPATTRPSRAIARRCCARWRRSRTACQASPS